MRRTWLASTYFFFTKSYLYENKLHENELIDIMVAKQCYQSKQISVQVKMEFQELYNNRRWWQHKEKTQARKGP